MKKKIALALLVGVSTLSVGTCFVTKTMSNLIVKGASETAYTCGSVKFGFVGDVPTSQSITTNFPSSSLTSLTNKSYTTDIEGISFTSLEYIYGDSEKPAPIKFGSSKNNGKLVMSLPQDAIAVTVYAVGWKDKNSQLTVNNVAKTMTNKTTKTSGDETIEYIPYLFQLNSNSSTITFTSKERVIISNIAISFAV